MHTAGCKLSLVIVAHRRLGRKRVVFSLTFWRQQVSVFYHVYTVVQGRKARSMNRETTDYLRNYDVSYQVYVKLRELSEPPTQLYSMVHQRMFSRFSKGARGQKNRTKRDADDDKRESVTMNERDPFCF